MEVRPCNNGSCPDQKVDGNWSDWTLSPCSVSCGGGTQTASRKCNNPAPANGGKPCPGDATKPPQPCNTQSCTQCGQWSNWSACSVTCGSGTRSRTRTSSNPAQCPPAQTEPCTQPACPQGCDWGQWGACSSTCGVAYKTRTQVGAGCSTTPETAPCTDNPNCPVIPTCQRSVNTRNTCGLGIKTRQECEDIGCCFMPETNFGPNSGPWCYLAMDPFTFGPSKVQNPGFEEVGAGAGQDSVPKWQATEPNTGMKQITNVVRTGQYAVDIHPTCTSGGVMQTVVMNQSNPLGNCFNVTAYISATNLGDTQAKDFGVQLDISYTSMTVSMFQSALDLVPDSEGWRFVSGQITPKERVLALRVMVRHKGPQGAAVVVDDVNVVMSPNPITLENPDGTSQVQACNWPPIPITNRRRDTDTSTGTTWEVISVQSAENSLDSQYEWSEWAGVCTGAGGMQSREPKCSSLHCGPLPPIEHRPCPTCLCTMWAPWTACDCQDKTVSRQRGCSVGVAVRESSPTGKCLVDEGGVITLGSCTSRNLLSVLLEQSKGQGALVTGHTTCVSMNSASTNITNTQCDDSNTQQWAVTLDGSIRHISTGHCLSSCQGLCPSPLSLRPCDGSVAQRFVTQSVASNVDTSQWQCSIIAPRTCSALSGVVCGMNTDKAECEMLDCCWAPTPNGTCWQPARSRDDPFTLPTGTKQSKPCNDCDAQTGWSQWGNWGSCSATCGSGAVRRRLRACNGDHTHCPGDSQETSFCSLPPCVIAGAWSDWSSWGACSHECGGGSRGAYRSCTNPPPQNGGASCEGESVRVEDCRMDPCASSSAASALCDDYSPWTDCTQTCGGGTQMRVRNSTDSSVCLPTQTRECNTQPCPVPSQCKVTNSDKSRCGDAFADSSSCEAVGCCYDSDQAAFGWPACFLPALSTGKNLVSNPSFEVSSVNTQTLQTEAQGWTTIGHATVSPQLTRTGFSALRVEAYGLEGGSVRQSIPIGQKVPLCLDISAWAQPWNVTVTNNRQFSLEIELIASDGTMQQEILPFDSSSEYVWSRLSATVRPDHPVSTLKLHLRYSGKTGVAFFDDIVVSQIACGEATTVASVADGNVAVFKVQAQVPVDGQFSAWSDWSQCSGDCGSNVGITMRTRTCTNPEPSGGGKHCFGPNLEIMNCTTTTECGPAVDGVWTNWSPWSSCSGHCGPNRSWRLRHRKCSFPDENIRGKTCEGEDTDEEQCTSTLCKPCACTDWVQQANCNCSVFLAPYTRQCFPTTPTVLRQLTDNGKCASVLRMPNPGEIGMSDCLDATDVYYDPVEQKIRVGDNCLTLLDDTNEGNQLVQLRLCKTEDPMQQWNRVGDTWRPQDSTGLCLTSCPAGKMCGDQSQLVAATCDDSPMQDWVLEAIGEPQEQQCEGYMEHKMHQCVAICQLAAAPSDLIALINITLTDPTRFDNQTFIQEIKQVLKGKIDITNTTILNGHLVVTVAVGAANRAIIRAIEDRILSKIDVIQIKPDIDYCGILPGCAVEDICDTDHGSSCKVCNEGYTLSDGGLCVPDSSTAQSTNSGSSSALVAGLTSGAAVAAALLGVGGAGYYVHRTRQHTRRQREELERGVWRVDSALLVQQSEFGSSSTHVHLSSGSLAASSTDQLTPIATHL